MKRTVMLLSSAALALSFAAAKPAHAGSPPNAAVQGTWAFGSYISSDSNVANGTLTFDGNGGVTGVLNYFSDGYYCAGMGLNGSYVVNPGKLSGTATMTATSVSNAACGDAGDGDTVTLAFFLSNSLKTMNYVEIDPDSPGFLPDEFEDYALGGPATHF